jgi:CBS domain-containing protein
MTVDLTVQEAKRYGVLSCTPDHTLLQAAQRMLAEDVSALVVVDDQGYLRGIISRTDLMRARVHSPSWQTELVSNHMVADVATVSPLTTLREVAGILLDRQIHRVVVVRKEDQKLLPISVVSAADIVYHMTKEAER